MESRRAEPCVGKVTSRRWAQTSPACVTRWPRALLLCATKAGTRLDTRSPSVSCPSGCCNGGRSSDGLRRAKWCGSLRLIQIWVQCLVFQEPAQSVVAARRPDLSGVSPRGFLSRCLLALLLNIHEKVWSLSVSLGSARVSPAAGKNWGRFVSEETTKMIVGNTLLLIQKLGFTVSPLTRVLAHYPHPYPMPGLSKRNFKS